MCNGMQNESETKACPMTTPPFENRPPADDRITAYDERHFVTYLRLLDADDEGADWREAAQIIFELDAVVEPASWIALAWCIAAILNAHAG